MSWWHRLGTTASPAVEEIPEASEVPELECDWLEKFTAWHPQLFAISAAIVACAAERAELERTSGPVDFSNPKADDATPNGVHCARIRKRALELKGRLERWRFELPTSLSCPRIQVGSFALWHASRIILLTQVYGRGRRDPQVQTSAKAVIELCCEAGDKPEFLQLVSSFSRPQLNITARHGRMLRSRR